MAADRIEALAGVSTEFMERSPTSIPAGALLLNLRMEAFAHWILREMAGVLLLPSAV